MTAKPHQTSIPCPYCGKGVNEDSAGCPGIKIGYHVSQGRSPRDSEIILRGNFHIVRSTDDFGKVEHRMVLMGLEPENRKMILVEEGTDVELLTADRLVFRVHLNKEGWAKVESA